jgi:hypothetical protein
MKTLYIIKCQSKEWYGDPDQAVGDPTYGRYKMKGGQDFVFEADHQQMDDEEDKIFANFNEKYDKVGRFYRYEAKSIDWYSEPVVAKLVDGEIIIPFTDSLDGTSV